MNAIGGYFALDLLNNKEFHLNCLKLNTARNALEYILIARKYKKIYLPFYTCDVLLQPIEKLKVIVEFYNINKDFEPIFDYSRLKQNEGFLYTNYFGLKDSYIRKIDSLCKNLIIDNAQSFYSKPVINGDTFYSARKFFGVSDGAYLYCNKPIQIEILKDISWKRSQYLFIRIDEEAETGYQSFKKNESELDFQEIKYMSNLTSSILGNIDYKTISEKRRDNYIFLSNELGSINKLKFNINKKTVPMVYPFYSTNENLREILRLNKIYTAQYWDSILKNVEKGSIEYDYTKNIIYLPIDQRLNSKQLKTIIKIIKDEHKR